MRAINHPLVSANSHGLGLALLLVCSHANAEALPIAACQQSTGIPSVATVSWPRLPDRTPLSVGCWITSEQLQQQAFAAATLIDVRATAGNQPPIEGALALALTALQGSVVLKEQQIVLIGDGYDRLALDRSCTSLKASGFTQVSALLGGAPALHRTTTVNPQQAEVSAQEFWNGSLAIPWQIATLGLNEEQTSRLPQQPALRLDLADNATASQRAVLAAELVALAQSSSTVIGLAEPTPLVLIATDAASTQRLQMMLADYLPAGAVWLRGGLHAYQEYIQRQRHISSHAGQPLISPCG